MSAKKKRSEDIGRLIITRGHRQAFWVDDTRIEVEIPLTKGRQIRLMIEARKSVAIQREELLERDKDNE